MAGTAAGVPGRILHDKTESITGATASSMTARSGMPPRRLTAPRAQFKVLVPEEGIEL
jgi:hypothetical protein